MLALVVILVSSAAPPPLTLGSPGIKGVKVRLDELTYYSAFFANLLRQQGLKVVGTEPGVDAILNGTLSREGVEGMQIDLTVVNANEDKLAAFTVTAQNEHELLELLRRAAQEIASVLFHKLEKMPVPQVQLPLPPEPEKPRSVVPGLGVAAGGIAVIGGGVALVIYSWNQIGSVRAGAPLNYSTARAQADGAKTTSAISLGLLVGGAVVFCVGAGYAVNTARSNTRLLVAPMPGGAMVGLSGSLP